MQLVNRRNALRTVAIFVIAVAVALGGTLAADAHPNHTDPPNDFDTFIKDVSQDDPKYPFAKQAYEEFIVHGFAGGFLKLTEAATRGDVIVMLVNTLNQRIYPRLDGLDSDVDGLVAAVHDLQDAPPAISGLEADSPYPGATQLADIDGNHGANSDAKWVGDEGATLQQSWVQCPDGKVATGGGFSRADEPVSAIKNLQIVTDTFAYIEDGEVTSLTGGGAIEGDEAGSIEPNGWLVEGFNDGTSELIVRPSVVCAAIADAG